MIRLATYTTVLVWGLMICEANTTLQYISPQLYCLLHTRLIINCIVQRHTNIFQRGGAEVEDRLTGRGGLDVDNNMAVTQPGPKSPAIILLLSQCII